MRRHEGIVQGKANGPATATTTAGAGTGTAPANQQPETEAEEPTRRIDATERLTRELARLRAKFGADPAIARSSLEEAWMSPTAAMEEDEAEFIDAVADCLGVGLSLDAALTCWDSGGLFYDAAEDATDDESDTDLDEAPEASLPAVIAHHAHVSGRRLLIP
jgi:hypothetical protein